MTNTPDVQHLLERIETLEHAHRELLEQLNLVPTPEAEPLLGVAAYEPPTDAELRQARLNHYAATCPITLTEVMKIAQFRGTDPNETALDLYVELRWEYARKMDAEGTKS